MPRSHQFTLRRLLAATLVFGSCLAIIRPYGSAAIAISLASATGLALAVLLARRDELSRAIMVAVATLLCGHAGGIVGAIHYYWGTRDGHALLGWEGVHAGTVYGAIIGGAMTASLCRFVRRRRAATSVSRSATPPLASVSGSN